MASDAGEKSPASVESEMQGDGSAEGCKSEGKEKLVPEGSVGSVEAGKADLAEGFEIARGEERFGFHGQYDG